MTIKELLDFANGYYDGRRLSNHYDHEGNFLEWVDGCDWLAHFIVREIIETFDEALDSRDQLEVAVETMRRARYQVERVCYNLGILTVTSNGVEYTCQLVSRDGAKFTLHPKEHQDADAIAVAKAYLKNEHDVVGAIKVQRVPVCV